MLKKLKKLSASTLIILMILVGFGGFTLARTVRKDIIQVLNSDEDILTSVKKAAMNFPDDFEQLIPHERKINTLLYYTTGIFNSNHVIWGKDDWLFYSSKNSGDPIADYEGTNSYSAEELDLAKENILSQQNTLHDMGIKFCLLLPPNKENVYAQFMPDKYDHTNITRTDVMAEYLSNSGVNCVNPKAALMSCDEKYRTYFKLDTHWNELGAYIGTQEVLLTFGISLPAMTDQAIEEGDSTTSDLADMVGLTNVFPPDYGFRMAYTSHFDGISTETNGAVTHHHNDNAQVDGSILLIGDSFRSAMIPVFRTVFKDFYVVHRSEYHSSMLQDISPDYVILEVVERHSDILLDIVVI